MPSDSPENWFLKKHENGEVFGPVRFDKIAEWARTAQVNPQDLISNDGEVWTRPPMIPELEMDWLVELGENILYGPTTAGTLLEFVKSAEISATTRVINCVDGTTCLLSETDFFAAAQEAPGTEHASADLPIAQPLKGGIRANLQKRVRELEQNLMAKQRQLNAAKDTIRRLESRNKELETRLNDVSRFGTKG